MSQVAKHPAQRKGLLSAVISLPVSALMWLAAGLVISIAIEWVGMTWIWSEQGPTHSERMVRYEAERLASIDRAWIEQPAILAREVSKFLHTWLFQKTGLEEVAGRGVTTDILRDVPMDETMRQAAESLGDYIRAAINITQVYALRVVILVLALPLFLIAALAGAGDGLVRRDLRRFTGARESSWIYHHAKRWVWPTIATAWVIYLGFPESMDPAWVLVPAAAAFGFAISVMAASFKKYV